MNSVDVIGLVKEKVINMKFKNDMDYAETETSKRAEDLSKNAEMLDTLEHLKEKMQQLEFDIIVEGTKREKLFDNLSQRLRQPVGELIDDGKSLKKSGKMKGFGYNPLEEDGRVKIDTDGDGKWDAVRYRMDDEGNVHYIGDAAYEIAEEIGSFRANITDQLDTMTNTVIQVIDHMGESERQVELDHQYMEQEMNHTISELEYGFDGMRDDLNLIYNFTEAIFQNGSFYTDTLQNLQTLVTKNEENTGIGCNFSKKFFKNLIKILFTKIHCNFTCSFKVFKKIFHFQKFTIFHQISWNFHHRFFQTKTVFFLLKIIFGMDFQHAFQKIFNSHASMTPIFVILFLIFEVFNNFANDTRLAFSN